MSKRGPYLWRIPGFPEWFAREQSGRPAVRVAEMIGERWGISVSPEKVKFLRHRHGFHIGKYRDGERRPVPETCMTQKWKEHLRRIRRLFWESRTHESVRKYPVNMVMQKNNGYLWIKTGEPKEWKPLHRWVYEKLHGPIPEGKRVVFLDGDNLNFSADNLDLATEEENLQLNRLQGFPSSDSDIGRIKLDTAKVATAVSRARRKEKEAGK